MSQRPALSDYSASLKPSMPRATLTAPSDTTMRELWLWMATYYGAKWSTPNGDVYGEAGPTGALWRAELSGLTPSDIARGMKACRDREDKWPPSLQDFRDLCKPVAVDHSEDWKTARADPRKMPGPKRLAWHHGNISHIQNGGELPRDVAEPKVWE